MTVLTVTVTNTHTLNSRKSVRQALYDIRYMLYGQILIILHCFACIHVL